ncbi:MAG: hypothetical protein IKS28_00240 [Clostridia bacterium]|nr:hypothetical protein [Clostridia bacterium]
MKKKLVLFLVIAVSVCACYLCGCAVAGSESVPVSDVSRIDSDSSAGSSESAKEEIQDRTVASGDFFLPRNDAIMEQLDSQLDFEKIYKTEAELFNAAECVVYGVVQDISYFDESGSANTVYSFRVERSIKGSVTPNSLISVITAGGYLRLEKLIAVQGNERYQDKTEDEIKNTVYHCSIMGTEEPSAGARYVLYLAKPTENETPLPDGLYPELGAFMGRLKELPDGSFSRIVPPLESAYYGSEKTTYAAEEIFR